MVRLEITRYQYSFLLSLSISNEGLILYVYVSDYGTGYIRKESLATETVIGVLAI